MDLFSSSEATGIAYGAGTVLNAMAMQHGCAFGIDLYTRVRVRLKPGEFKVKYSTQTDKGKTLKVNDTLVRECIKEYFNEAGIEPLFSFDVLATTSIPPAKGLKSSSSLSLALELALNGLSGLGIDDETLLRLSVAASRAAGVTMTGAYDDACACYFGGYNVTDNRENRLIRREPIEDLAVLIYLGRGKAYSGKMTQEMFNPIKERIMRAYDWAVNHNYSKAMRLGTRAYCEVFGYDDALVEVALDAGAEMCGLSGKGPAFHALVKREKLHKVMDAWKLHGYKNLIITGTNNRKAGLV